MRTLLTILLSHPAIFFWAFYATTSHAEDTLEYDIEIVFFEDTTNRYSGSEQWPNIEHELLANNDTPVKNADTPETSHSSNAPVFKAIEKEVSSLKKYIEKLEKSTRYNVLTRKAWRQAGLDTESAIDVYIDSTNNKTSLNKKINTRNPATYSNIPSSSSQSSSIRGTVKIVLGRYLHAYTDMIYQKPGSSYMQNELPVNNTKGKEYLIKSHRRMRSNELHYIDHPLVGILIMAQPVKMPEVEIEEIKVEHDPISSNQPVGQSNN